MNFRAQLRSPHRGAQAQAHALCSRTSHQRLREYNRRCTRNSRLPNVTGHGPEASGDSGRRRFDTHRQHLRREQFYLFTPKKMPYKQPQPAQAPTAHNLDPAESGLALVVLTVVKDAGGQPHALHLTFELSTRLPSSASASLAPCLAA